MMTIISRVRLTSVLIIICILSQPNLIFSQNSSDFAKYLMSQRDYFRAIGVYKQLLFESTTSSQKYSYCTQISEAYRLSGKYKSSIYFYSEALQNVSTDEEKASSFIGLGLNYYYMKTIPIARDFFLRATKLDTSGRAKLFLGLIDLDQMNWAKAKTTFEEIASTEHEPQITATAKLLIEKSNAGAKLPHKSPIVAAIMSSILPGSGQIYAGHYFDGLQAMAYVGVFSLATYSAYRYDRDINDSDSILLLSATITGLLYSANILGAYKTAKFRNMRINQNFINDVRRIVLEVSF